MKVTYKYTSYEVVDKELNGTKEVPDGFDTLAINYDGGRFNVILNGKVVFDTFEAGTDFAFEVINE